MERENYKKYLHYILWSTWGHQTVDNVMVKAGTWGAMRNFLFSIFCYNSSPLSPNCWLPIVLPCSYPIWSSVAMSISCLSAFSLNLLLICLVKLCFRNISVLKNCSGGLFLQQFWSVGQLTIPLINKITISLSVSLSVSVSLSLTLTHNTLLNLLIPFLD